MPDNYTLAFVNTKESINEVLNYALSKSIKKLICVSEEALTLQPPPIDVTIQNIAEFKPDDLDQRVLHEIDKQYSKWLQHNAELKNILYMEEIGSVVRMSFDSIIFQFYRRVILANIIIKAYSPAMVIVDNYWLDFFNHDTYKKIKFHIINQNNQHTSSFTAVAGYFRKIKYTLATLLGGIILPVVLGKCVNLFSDTVLYDNPVMLVGADQSNKSFMPVWEKITPHFSSHGKGKYSTLNVKTVWDDIRQKKCWLDGLIPFKYFPGIVVRFLKLSYLYFKAKENFPLPGYREGHSLAINFASDFTINIDYFFLRTFAKSLLFGRVAYYFTNEKLSSLHVVIFTTLSSASKALSAALQKHGIKTVTTTHGMVLEPIAYRSEDSLKLTWSAFDAKLLANYSHDNEYIGLPANPEGFKDGNASEFPPWSVIQFYQPVCQGHQSKKSTSSYPIRLGKIAMIFPSTNQHGNSLKRFIGLCLDYLHTNSEKHHFDTIVIKPKKHPRTKIKEFETVLHETIPADFTIPILLTWDMDINAALQTTTFALCAHSSIILDCMRLVVPFSVYIYGSLSNSIFLNTFPKWMRFTNRTDLSKITQKDLSEFNLLSRKLIGDYWGENDTSDSVNYFISSILGKNSREKTNVYSNHDVFSKDAF